MDNPLYALRDAMAAARFPRERFNHHANSGALDRLFAFLGEDMEAHAPTRRGGAGTGRGSGRAISADATLVVAIAARLLLRNVDPDTAFRIGGVFVFLGEMGQGLRSIAPAGTAAMRPAGGLFPADLGDTFLAVLPAALHTPGGQGYAFVPERDLTADNLAAWSAENDADGQSLILVNLSQVVAQVRAALGAVEAESLAAV